MFPAFECNLSRSVGHTTRIFKAFEGQKTLEMIWWIIMFLKIMSIGKVYFFRITIVLLFQDVSFWFILRVLDIIKLLFNFCLSIFQVRTTSFSSGLAFGNRSKQTYKIIGHPVYFIKVWERVKCVYSFFTLRFSWWSWDVNEKKCSVHLKESYDRYIKYTPHISTCLLT